MSNINSTWIIDNLRIVIFGDDPIPFKETETSNSITGSEIFASIKHDENGENVIKEAISLEDELVFSLAYFENQNVIEFSLNLGEEQEKKTLLDTVFNKIIYFTKKFYSNNSFKIKRMGVISDFYQTNFDDAKNDIYTINYLGNYDDFDIRLNKSFQFGEVKINQAVSFNSSERLFMKIEEPLNIPVPNMQKVARLMIDVNTDVENKSIGDYTETLMKLVELSKKLIANGGRYEK